MRKSIVLKNGAMKCTDILEKGKETDRVPPFYNHKENTYYCGCWGWD